MTLSESLNMYSTAENRNNCTLRAIFRRLSVTVNGVKVDDDVIYNFIVLRRFILAYIKDHTPSDVVACLFDDPEYKIKIELKK